MEEKDMITQQDINQFAKMIFEYAQTTKELLLGTESDYADWWIRDIEDKINAAKMALAKEKPILSQSRLEELYSTLEFVAFKIDLGVFERKEN